MLQTAAGRALEFRVLGPLDVSREGRPLRLRGDRQRALLALLLLHANEVVPSERLVEELFGADAPDTALNALRVAISRLRRLLEDGNGKGSVLVTRSHGYLLCVEPQQLDLALFERLLDQGRRAFESGDPTGAAVTLREALALWRGPALADLALLDFAQPEIRRLEELRLTALQERIEADLALGRSAELVAELEALVAANPLQERLRGQLMLALYRSGRQADALAVYRDTRELLSDELGLEPSRALQELERSILRQDPALERDAPTTPATALPDRVVVCPFKGLASFAAADAEYFFGRERLVADLVARSAGSTLVGVIGPSGSGKSSAVQAGLVPALGAGVLPGSDRWPALVVRPGEHPRVELPTLPQGQRLVLAVDQLEEVFTLCRDEAERADFLGQLGDLVLDAARRTLVIVALRADFYGRCAAYPHFAELLSSNHVLVGPMERDELARATELPAARAGLQVERALVDALVADVAGEPGALPLLSTALLELWRLRDGRLLRYETYRSSGGVRGAVARLAESAYGELSEDERPVARGIMLRLAADNDGTAVRRRIPLNQLDLERDETAARVVTVLTEARLLTASEGTLEVSHEALLSEWPRFRGWLEEDREGRRLHAHLSASAREWAARNRDSAELYRGARLAAALEWEAEHEREPNELERAFLETGRAEAERRVRRLRVLLAGVAVLLAIAVAGGVVAFLQRQTARHESRVALARQLGADAVSEPRIDRAMLLAREAVRLDRSTETAGTLLTTLLRSPALLGTLTFPIEARPSSGGITVSPDGRTLVVGDNHGELRFFDTQTRRETRSAFSGAFGYMPTIYSIDGSLLLTGAGGGPPPGLQLLDARTLRRVRLLSFDPRFLHPPIDTGAVTPLGLSRDGATAFFAYDLVVDETGREGPAYLDRWDVANGKRSTVALGSPDVVAASFIEEGGRIETVTSTKIEMWDTRTLRRLRAVRLPLTLGGYGAVSPDGRRVAGLRAGTASIVFVDTVTGGVTPGAGIPHGGGVLSLRFSPDGRTVVTTGDDGSVILWDPATGQPLETLTGHGGRVVASAFSADSRTLYTDALDGAILEWDVGGTRRFGQPFHIGLQPRQLPDVPQMPPLAVAPDSSLFATRQGSSSVAIYSLRTRVRLSLTAAGAGTVTTLAWSPTGHQLAVGRTSGSVLWSGTAHPHPLRRLRGLDGAVQGVAFSPDGRLVAAVDVEHPSSTAPSGGHLAVWHTDTGMLAIAALPLGQPGWSVGFSADGRRLAVGRDDGSVLVVDAMTGRVEHVLHPFGAPNVSLAFSPDGTLLTGSWAGIVERWNPAHGTRVDHPVLVAAAPVASISFGADGRTFSTTGLSDGLAKLWTTSTLEQFGATSFPGDPGALGHAVITSDDRYLVVVYDDSTGSVWPITTGAWERHACTVAGRNFTREEWARFVPGRKYATTCPDLPAG